MGTFNNLKQKAKGELEKGKGKLQQEQGETVKGGMQKLKGQADSAMADTKMKADEEIDKEENKH